LERVSQPKVRPEHVVHCVERFELGTPYTSLIQQVAQLLDRPEKQNQGARPLHGCVLGLDQTGVGRAVVEMFKAARPPCRLNPVTITSGSTATRDEDGWKVPKKDLVAVMEVLAEGK